jgi:DNA transformation protein
VSESLALIKEVLQSVGDDRHRRLFGGYGLFLDGLMFGLIADEVLYFKVDDGNRADFAAVGLLPFSYQRQGKSIQLSFSLRVSSN